MEEQRSLHDFERVYLERLRLAAQVILETAPDLELVTDPLEAELAILRISVSRFMSVCWLVPWVVWAGVTGLSAGCGMRAC
jgi:hypothetical protein